MLNYQRVVHWLVWYVSKLGTPHVFQNPMVNHGKSHVLFGIKSVVFWVVLYITHCATNPASRNSSHPHKCQLSSKNKVLLHKHLQKRSHAKLVGKIQIWKLLSSSINDMQGKTNSKSWLVSQLGCWWVIFLKLWPGIYHWPLGKHMNGTQTSHPKHSQTIHATCLARKEGFQRCSKVKSRW